MTTNEWKQASFPEKVLIRDATGERMFNTNQVLNTNRSKNNNQ